MVSRRITHLNHFKFDANIFTGSVCVNIFRIIFWNVIILIVITYSVYKAGCNILFLSLSSVFHTFKKVSNLSFLGGQSGRRQHLTQAPPLQCQAIRRGYVWVLGHRLQQQRGAAPPRSCSAPGGTWQQSRVRWGQTAGGGAQVTGEPSGGLSLRRRIHRCHLWLYWQLWAVEFTTFPWEKVVISHSCHGGVRSTQTLYLFSLLVSVLLSTCSFVFVVFLCFALIFVKLMLFSNINFTQGNPAENTCENKQIIL